MTIKIAINGYGRIGRNILRALYEWCVDSGYTPYVSVVIDAQTLKEVKRRYDLSSMRFVASTGSPCAPGRHLLPARTGRRKW